MPSRHHTPEAKAARRLRVEANVKARAALKRGDLVRKPCIYCRGEPAEMHHPDYGKPLEIIWVCRRHHMSLFHSKWPYERYADSLATNQERSRSPTGHEEMQ